MWLEADPDRLEQVLVNLLNNAAYTPPGGLIRLSAFPEEGQVVLRVADNGRGIPPESLNELFDLFVQGERTLGRSEGGLGIGLTIVKRLVELHGGTVEAHSEGGQGSEFLVRLPRAQEPPAQPVARPTPSIPARMRAYVGSSSWTTTRTSRTPSPGC